METLLVLAVVQLKERGLPFIKTTDATMIEVTAARHEGTDWDARQLERMKTKYVDRPGKPATRFGLIEQWKKGERGKDGRPGTPSEYLPTGILQMLV